MFEKEKLVKEQRLSEATRKNLVGLEGKFGTILKYLGDSIIGHSQGGGGGLFESNPMSDVWDIEEDESIPTADLDDNVMEEGMHFDGLRRGIHLEIIYKIASKEIAVLFEGYDVYRESEGELICYIPSERWESIIDKLFKIAKGKEVKHKVESKKRNEAEAEKLKSNFLKHLKKAWGG